MGVSIIYSKDKFTTHTDALLLNSDLVWLTSNYLIKMVILENQMLL